jgi:hypothetical protein
MLTHVEIPALSCDKKLAGINKIPVNTTSAEIQDSRIRGDFIYYFVHEYQLSNLSKWYQSGRGGGDKRKKET